MEKPPAVSNAALEQFVLLAKNVKGAAAAELVKQVTEAPGIYVFGELLDMPNIKEVSLKQYWCTFYMIMVVGVFLLTFV